MREMGREAAPIFTCVFPFGRKAGDHSQSKGRGIFPCVGQGEFVFAYVLLWPQGGKRSIFLALSNRKPVPRPGASL